MPRTAWDPGRGAWRGQWDERHHAWLDSISARLTAHVGDIVRPSPGMAQHGRHGTAWHYARWGPELWAQNNIMHRAKKNFVHMRSPQCSPLARLLHQLHEQQYHLLHQARFPLMSLLVLCDD